MDESSGQAVVLLLDLPGSAFCGIDLLSFTTSPRFKGIRNLTPGWHFLFTGVNSAFALRHGVWFFVEDHSADETAPLLLVFRWNSGTEDVVAVQDDSEVLKWRANLGGLWRECLTPYRQSVENPQANKGRLQEEKKDWSQLTDSLTANLLSRIVSQNQQKHWTVNSAASAPVDFDRIPGLSNEEEKSFSDQTFSFIPVDLKQTWREGAVGRERTEAAQDRSWALGQLIKNHCEAPRDFIGEMQFCFLMVLTLNNNSCMEQWRRLLTLILTCKSAAVNQPTFFEAFLRCLKLQLEHSQDAEGGLFDLSDNEGNLLKSLLIRFREGLEEYSGRAKSNVMDELDDVEEHLQNQHGWLLNTSHVRRGMLDLEDGERVEMDLNGADEEDEAGEYAPTIVELPSEHADGVPQLTICTASKKRSEGQTDPENMDSDYESEDDRALEEMDDRF